REDRARGARRGRQRDGGQAGHPGEHASAAARDRDAPAALRPRQPLCRPLPPATEGTEAAGLREARIDEGEGARSLQPGAQAQSPEALTGARPIL
ncbi:MAG: hypothetical protein ACK55I_46035, partial [bacterium]